MLKLNINIYISKLKKYAGAIIYKIINSRGGVIVFLRHYYSEHNKNFFDLIDSIKKESRNSLTNFEFFNIYTLVNKTEKIDGEIAEVGVYKGGSAKVICESTKKQIHLFDTFEGLPETSKEDVSNKTFKKGNYKAPLNEVHNYLKDYNKIKFYKGLFPSTSNPIKNKRFSFVHLDVDLYKSTLDCLEFFYPRMNRGGVIISHDYNGAKGVKKAFDDFFKDKPEIIVEPLTNSSQCFIIKV